MNRWLLLALSLTITPLWNGCVTTTGSPQFPAAGLQQPPAGPLGETPAETAATPSTAAAETAAELLQRKAQREWPAKVLVVRLRYPRQNLDTTVRRAIEEAVAADPVLKPAEVIFTDAAVRWSRNDRSKFEELRTLAARFQARYVLMYDYDFNVANRTYWLPACVVLGTLGLIPLPVGGETIYCTTEFVVMDVASGLFLLSAQGHGRDQRTAVWGWMFEAGGAKPGEEKALRAALQEAMPHLVSLTRQWIESPRAP